MNQKKERNHIGKLFLNAIKQSQTRYVNVAYHLQAFHYALTTPHIFLPL